MTTAIYQMDQKAQETGWWISFLGIGFIAYRRGSKHVWIRYDKLGRLLYVSTTDRIFAGRNKLARALEALD